jgi:hypothetical protein
MPTEKPKIILVMESDLLKRIDDYRFENRINSRSDAIRRLIEAGLKDSQSDEKKQESITEEILSNGIKEIHQSIKDLNFKPRENLKNKPGIRKWTPEELELINKKTSMILESGEPKKET